MALRITKTWTPTAASHLAAHPRLPAGAHHIRSGQLIGNRIE